MLFLTNQQKKNRITRDLRSVTACQGPKLLLLTRLEDLVWLVLQGALWGEPSPQTSRGFWKATLHLQMWIGFNLNWPESIRELWSTYWKGILHMGSQKMALAQRTFSISSCEQNIGCNLRPRFQRATLWRSGKQSLHSLKQASILCSPGGVRMLGSPHH